MKRSDLHREWARVLDMCEGTNVDPKYCLKIDDKIVLFDHPVFNSDPNKYKFAVAIVEGRPVFVGDEVFVKNNRYPYINWKMFDCWKHDIECLSKDWTWTQSKRTFMLNGVELPCPVPVMNGSYCFNIGHHNYYFESKSDCQQAIDIIDKILLNDAAK